MVEGTAEILAGQCGLSILLAVLSESRCIARLGRDLEVLAVGVAFWTGVQLLLEGWAAPGSPGS